MKSPAHAGLIILLAGTLACGEDGTPAPALAPLSIEGDWEVVDVAAALARDGSRGVARSLFADTVEGGTSFVTFDAERVRAVNERGIGFRRAHEATYERTAETITIDGVVYAYTLTATDLVLDPVETGGAANELRLVRRGSAPDFDDWVTMYRTASTSVAVEAAGDIAFVDQSIWVAGGPDGRELRRVPLSSLTHDTFDTEIAARAVYATGGAFYVGGGSDRRVFTFDPGAGTTTSPTDPIGRDITAITGAGVLLWVFTAGESELHIWDTLFDRLRGSVNVGTHLREYGSEVGGAVIVGESIFISLDGFVTEFDVRPGDEAFTPELVPLRAFGLPGRYITGVTHDGTHFWVNSRSVDGGPWTIHRVVP